MQRQKLICVYADGSCPTPGGPGGWGVVIRRESEELIFAGNATETTSNRMELSAAIQALKYLTENVSEPSTVNVFSDSTYTVDSISKWGIQKPKVDLPTDKPNLDLIKELIAFKTHHIIHPIWVKGHSGVPMNEICDLIAGEEGRRISSIYFKDLSEEKQTLKILTKFHKKNSEGFWCAFLDSKDSREIFIGTRSGPVDFDLPIDALLEVLDKIEKKDSLELILTSKRITNRIRQVLSERTLKDRRNNPDKYLSLLSKIKLQDTRIEIAYHRK